MPCPAPPSRPCRRHTAPFRCAAAFILAGLPLILAVAVRADDALQKAVVEQARWRSIGPANMGGRIADIVGEEKSPFTYYLGTATGGLFKTTNDGTTWTPLFDHQSVASIGAVAIAPSDPKIVWVGTGEANGRNSSSWGDGVYKSTDGGQTWTHMGLKDSQEIGRIVVDPKDPNRVFVAAAGHLWGPNKERGVFLTTDGGKTWQHSLALNADTGAIDVALGAPGSGVVYAALYQRRRMPWGFNGWGPGSGLYRSRDNGKSWQRLQKGLPQGPLGRIGIAVARSKPDTVYAVIESPQNGGSSLFRQTSKYGGVFRSDDAGETWTRVSAGVPRGFYFGQIRVDPTTPERVYVLGFDLAVSEDGGKTFKFQSPGVHSDLHALWIDPTHPERLVLGTDGGVYISYDRAATWMFRNNLAIGEFYEVAVDNRQPFWAYGGLQDNGSWAGPTALQAGAGPGVADWIFLEGGDGFYVVPDPTHTDIVYAESQGGSVVRVDRRTNRRRYLVPSAPEGQPGYRFNWNSPVCLSPFDSDVVYIGGNRLFRWSQEGKEHEVISPDLSKQNGPQITAGGSGAETYGTIVSLAASPLAKGVLWAGTDDGNVQVTRDEGKTWENVAGALPGHVRNYYVKRLEASHFQAGRAYAAIDGHRNDDMKPYLFATEDYGKSWRAIANGLPDHAPVLAVREDPVNPDLLFAGTEFGAWVSFDRGGHWQVLQADLPTVAVDDLAIQTRDHSLVAATHGRSLYVLDNLLPLEEWTPKVQDAALHLFTPTPGVEYLPAGGGWFGGGGEFHGANREAGVEIVYWVRAKLDGAPSITITDAAGKTVATLNGDPQPGLHRLRWDMRTQDSTTDVFAERRENRFVSPGVYTVTLAQGKEKQQKSVTISGLKELSEPYPAGDSSAVRSADPDDDRP